MKNPTPKDDSPREIWLSPLCKCDGAHIRRDWADFEWLPCPVCGAKATRYVRPGLKRKAKQ